MTEDELLIAKAEDKIKASERRSSVTSTDFLDPHQQSVVRGRFGRGDALTRIFYYGGYDEAERVMMVCIPGEFLLQQADAADGGSVLPDGGPARRGLAPGTSDRIGAVKQVDMAMDEVMCVVRVTHKKGASASRAGRELTHSDYLGSLMSLGIERGAVGDILVREDGADILVPCEMADYLVNELRSAGKSMLEAERKELKDLILPVKEMKEKSDTVASPRLDNIVSSAFGLSRSKAVTAIKSGLVFVNHMEALKPSVMVGEGDEIVVRHKGRAILSEFGGKSKKGRQYITYLKD